MRRAQQLVLANPGLAMAHRNHQWTGFCCTLQDCRRTFALGDVIAVNARHMIAQRPALLRSPKVQYLCSSLANCSYFACVLTSSRFVSSLGVFPASLCDYFRHYTKAVCTQYVGPTQSSSPALEGETVYDRAETQHMCTPAAAASVLVPAKTVHQLAKHHNTI
jgi:hypothetical protein